MALETSLTVARLPLTLILGLALGSDMLLKGIALIAEHLREFADQAHNLALLTWLKRAKGSLLGLECRQRITLGKSPASSVRLTTLFLRLPSANSNVAKPRAVKVLIAELMVCLL